MQHLMGWQCLSYMQIGIVLNAVNLHSTLLLLCRAVVVRMKARISISYLLHAKFGGDFVAPWSPEHHRSLPIFACNK
jgi:hypothetical protein